MDFFNEQRATDNYRADKTMSLSHDLDKWIYATNPIVPMPKEYPAGHEIPLHQHPRAQLVYAVDGMMELRTLHEYWLLPPLRGVWIPPFVDHQMRTRTPVSLRTLYVDLARLSMDLPSRTVGINISPLLREQLIRASLFSIDYKADSFESRLLEITLEEILNSSAKGLNLPTGKDRRLRHICNTLINNPGDMRSLADWAQIVGATTRTLTRLFKNEIGTSFVYWRQQLRIVNAIFRLNTGEPISQVAECLGYSSQSAFTVMFKRVTGNLPSEHLRKP
jgi:AraC-like DNA-binding protein